MTIYAVSTEELIALTMFSRWQTNSVSPLKNINLAIFPEGQTASLNKYIKSLISTEMLVVKKTGEILPSKEVDIFLKILQETGNVISVQRAGLAGIKEYYLCEYGDIWSVYGNSIDGKNHFINFPLEGEEIKKWFIVDILTDFQPTNKLATQIDFDLNRIENILLLAVQNLYATRHHGQPLKESELWFTEADLMTEDLKSFITSLPLFFTPEQINKLNSELNITELIDSSLANLSKRGILAEKQDEKGTSYFSYSKTLQEWFDPAGLQDIIVIRQDSPVVSGKIIYLRSNGYLILSAVQDNIRLLSLPFDAKPSEVAANIFNLKFSL